MKKSVILVIPFALAIVSLRAQTKVFKEVGEEISTQFKMIRQDNALVGYLAFTRLEKASADSFNYRITITDENLNDIGVVNFREESLYLQDISFESDVLCIAYLKSNVLGNTYKRKEFNDAKDNAKNAIMFQFLGLDGKIVKANTVKASVNISSVYTGKGASTLLATGGLKHSIKLSNVPEKGFVCFYGDESISNLISFSTTGEQIWQKKVSEDADWFLMKTTPADVYLLAKHKQAKPVEGGFVLLGYNLQDGAAYDKFNLQDKQGNDLKVLAFDNDPLTGKIYLSGQVINPDKGNQIYSGRQFSHGPYSGIFTINVNGIKKADINQVYSYWGDGSQEESISEKGRFADNKAYALLGQSFRDFDGNTYFVGSAMIKRVKWGSVASSVILSPLVLPTIGILGLSGTSKCKITDVVMLKQNAKGAIYFDNAIEANNSNFFRSMYDISAFNHRSFYRVVNSETKTNYVVIDDVKDIIIYNAAKRKVVRTIPHKDGQIKTDVYPAKEGYIMISEYNKKEKFTRFSIEAL